MKYSENIRNLFASERADLDRYHSLTGEDIYADGYQGENWNADGGAAETNQASEPFIITLTETAAAAAVNVNFLNAVASIGATNDGVTSTGGGITATYNIAGYTYAQFLRSLHNQTFICGGILIESDTAANLRQTLQVQSYNLQGNFFGKTLTMKKNLWQNQTDGVWIDCRIPIVDTTVMVYSRIAASTNVVISFYPMAVANRLRDVMNGRQYGQPGLNGVIPTAKPKPQALL